MKNARSNQGKQHLAPFPGAGTFARQCSVAGELVSVTGEFALPAGGEESPQAHGGQQALPAPDAAVDLRQEAANMLELTCSQSGRETALSISSKGAQAVLKQF